jgi:hypothetical protein
MRRRDIALLGGAAATWPLAAGAQQGGKVWLVGFLSDRYAVINPSATSADRSMTCA